MFKRITSFIITLILIISAVGMGLKPIPANAKNNKVSAHKVAFNKKFCIKPKKTIKIKKSNVSVTLDNYYKKTGYYDLTLKDKKKKYHFVVASRDEGCELYYEKYIPNYKIKAIKASGKKLYLKVSKRKNIPKAMSISGKASDHYETKKYEYLESDNIILFMDKGIKFDGNILSKFEEQLKEVEKLTGLKHTKHRCTYGSYCNNQQYIFGDLPFDGVDTKNTKIHVYVKNDIHPHCFAVPNDYSYFLINEMDLDVNNDDELCNAFIHECIHYLHTSNGTSFNSIINEGFAAYNEIRALRKYQKDHNIEDTEFYERFGYTLKKGEVTEANAESLFLKEYTNTERVYPYGFAFMTYLHETYGEKALTNLFSAAKIILKKEVKNQEIDHNDLSSKGCAKLLKKKYSKTIFKDFAKWLNNNPQFISEY